VFAEQPLGTEQLVDCVEFGERSAQHGDFVRGIFDAGFVAVLEANALVNCR
jgi:hypothetical protein